MKVISNLFDSPLALDLTELAQILEFHTGQNLGEPFTDSLLPRWAASALQMLPKPGVPWALKTALVFQNAVILLQPEYNQYALVRRVWPDHDGLKAADIEIEWTSVADPCNIAPVYEFLGVAKAAALIRQPGFEYSRWHGYGQPKPVVTVSVERPRKSLTDDQLAAMVAADKELAERCRTARAGRLI